MADTARGIMFLMTGAVSLFVYSLINKGLRCWFTSHYSKGSKGESRIGFEQHIGGSKTDRPQKVIQCCISWWGDTRNKLGKTPGPLGPATASLHEPRGK